MLANIELASATLATLQSNEESSSFIDANGITVFNIGLPAFNNEAKIEFATWLTINAPKASISDDVYYQRVAILEGKTPQGVNRHFIWYTQHHFGLVNGKLIMHGKEVIRISQIFDIVKQVHCTLLHA